MRNIFRQPMTDWKRKLAAYLKDLPHKPFWASGYASTQATIPITTAT
jgi:hypothetical protein